MSKWTEWPFLQSSELVTGEDSARPLHKHNENQIPQSKTPNVTRSGKAPFWKEHSFYIFIRRTFKIPRPFKSIKPNLVIKKC